MRFHVVDIDSLGKSMICINHFCATDITKSKFLKKGAVPTIFGANQSTDTIDTPDANYLMTSPQEDQQAESNENNELCELRKECSIQKINDQLHISKLEKQIVDLKNTIKIQSEHINKLDKNTAKQKKAINLLENTLEELKQQNLISKRAMDVLEVI